MLFEEIQSKIWGFSASAGTSPFTILHFEIDEETKSKAPADYLNRYTQGIAFFLWDDYSVEDYTDYLSLSKQYLMIEGNQAKDNFLLAQAAKMTEDRAHFFQWQLNQIFIALGFAINEIRVNAMSCKEVEFDDIDFFRPSLSVKGASLKEVILF